MNRSIHNTKTLPPHLLTGIIGIRFLIACVLPILILQKETGLAVLLLTVAIVSDFLDGFIGRRWQTASLFGPYGDPLADFCLVTAAFVAFVTLGLYPIWTIGLIIVMFAQFVLTSRQGRPVYDPVGKYFGVVLFGVIGLSLVWPNESTVLVGTATMITLALLTSVTRHLYLDSDLSNS